MWWEIHKGQSEWALGTALPHGANTENVKRYIDFAAAHGASYVLAEGWNEGWATMYTMQNFLQPTPDFDLQEVVSYAKSKGVDWIAHTETGGNVTNFENQIEAAFSLYESLGVPGVKTGYAGGTSIGGVEHAHYDQAMVNHYRDVIRIAAKHHLVVEAHEMVKDTGERRIYPNILTREAVRGIEWEAWSEGNPPEHLVEVPFTRMVAGPVSYTPGIFNITWDPGGPGRPPWRTLEHTRVHSTRAAQMAIYPVYLSGLQMMADVPGELRRPARSRVPRTSAHHLGRHRGPQRPGRRLRDRSPTQRPGLVHRQHQRRAAQDTVGPAATAARTRRAVRRQHLRRRPDHRLRDQPQRDRDHARHRQPPRHPRPRR